MSIDTSHLLDPESIPSGIPDISAPISKRNAILPGDGIGVQEINDDYIVYVDESVVQDAVRAAVQLPQEDPLTGMGFRVSYSDGVVSINRGYILNSYYVNPEWKSEETLVSAGTISVKSDFAGCSIYIAIGMTVFGSEENSPWTTYYNQASIESTVYVSAITLNTQWSGLDLAQFTALGESSLFEIYYETPSAFPVDGKVRILLADIDADGVVAQSHLGLITLPQTYETKVQAWELT